MKLRTFIFSLLAICSLACQSQPKTPPTDRIVGGPCDGCEALLEYGDRALKATDTIPGYGEFTPNLLLSGTVYQSDGRTPAADIVLYFYHTDTTGIYPPAAGAKGYARRHGQHRGWIKTGSDGTYNLYTFRPAPYPGRSNPAHIHLTIKEPGLIPYYAEDFFFSDDPLLTEAHISRLSSRAGSGIITPQKQGNHWLLKRDIILGQNIPDYP